MLQLPLEDIQVGERLRALSADAVSRLAASLKEIGLRQPISVRLVEEMELDGKLTAGVPVLVAGHHRLAAARQLGWSHIDCIEVNDDQLRAELWEIDENLMRSELSPAQHAEHLVRRKELWEALNHSGRTSPEKAGRPRGFAGETADMTGTPKRTTNQQVARAEALGGDLGRVVGTSLDKGVELDALARLQPEQRAPIIERARAGEKVSARPALAEQEVTLKQANAIIAAWNRASEAARAIAMEQMDGPVFDRSRSA